MSAHHFGRLDPAELAADKTSIVYAFRAARDLVLGRMTREEQLADTERPAPPTLPAPPPLKTCQCGRDYAADEWARLTPPPGGATWDLGDGEVLSLRNCPPPCMSTLAIELDEAAE